MGGALARTARAAATSALADQTTLMEVVEHEHLGALARAALVAGDLAALGVHGERRAAEAHLHRAAGVGRGDRVARAAHRDARLAVGLRPQRDRRVVRLGGEGPERGPLGLRRLADGGEAAGDVAGVVCAVGCLELRVQLGHALHARNWHEVAAAEAADLALHAALLVRAAGAGLAEERVEAVVRAQRGEAVALDAVATGEHAHHGRLEVVVTDPPRHPAETREGDRVALEERLLALAREADVDRPPRVREPHHEHRELGQLPVQEDAHPAEVGLRLLARGMQLGDGHLGAAGPEFAAQPADVGAHRRYSLCTTSCLMHRIFGCAMCVSRPVGLAARGQDLGVVPEAVEQRRGQLLVAEDLHPLAEGEVGGDDRRAPLVAVGEEVEQQLAAGALEGHEAEFVDDQQRDPQVTLMQPRERELVARLDQLAHEVGRAHEGHAVSPPGGLDAKRDREVRLAGADRPGDHDVLGALQVVAGGELGELRPLDAPQGLPVELLEGLEVGEARPGATGALPPSRGFGDTPQGRRGGSAPRPPAAAAGTPRSPR